MGLTTADVKNFVFKFVSKSTFCDIEERLDDFIIVQLVVLVSTRILGTGRK